MRRIYSFGELLGPLTTYHLPLITESGRIRPMLRKLLALSVLLAEPVRADIQWQRLSWIAPDGVSIVGDYHPAEKSGALTWVLLHGLGSTRGEWKRLAEGMAKQGNGILIYDARGHGESTHTLLGQTLNYQEWRSIGPGTPWDTMNSDLSGMVQNLVTQMHLPEKQVAIGGASLGANIALVYASQHQAVPALLLLSPGLVYAGIETPVAYKAYQSRPVLIAASPGDAYAAASVQQLSNLAKDPQQSVAEPKSGHGVQMLDAEFTKKLLEWMKHLNGNRNRRTS